MSTHAKACTARAKAAESGDVDHVKIDTHSGHAYHGSNPAARGAGIVCNERGRKYVEQEIEALINALMANGVAFPLVDSPTMGA